MRICVKYARVFWCMTNLITNWYLWWYLLIKPCNRLSFRHLINFVKNNLCILILNQRSGNMIGFFVITIYGDANPKKKTPHKRLDNEVVGPNKKFFFVYRQFLTWHIKISIYNNSRLWNFWPCLSYRLNIGFTFLTSVIWLIERQYSMLAFVAPSLKNQLTTLIRTF